MHNIIEITNLQKKYGTKVVLKDINLKIKQNEIITLIGASGAGKSSLLRCLNLLEEPDFGTILFEGTNILNPKYNVYNLRKKIGMVFQHFNLFAHKNVLNNCTLALTEVFKKSKEEAQTIAREKLQKVGLLDVSSQSIQTLSGGQKQRVAIARALCMNPEIILFDEPTASLDPQLTKEVLDIMTNLTHEKITIILVTHEIAFAQKISDRIVFMADGIILEEGTPQQILNNPQSDKLKTFLKDASFNKYK
ncbi:MAG: amino acid ABC transporter ATP-binding protein [Candidatus Phytoplasma asteris]|uniref:ABC-type polar amino acid transport system, ATPase component n=1 Tax='Chrysanthemum coronarium' phytoplasma TaxID=1520703 RepID=A0ABQ0J3H2_9MOLU|nr:amino acid ABC transporter ATP-binding protein ['Chrysanthemum coronarium' phytoplasma]TKA87906.1 MAG: ABC-type amino acid transport system ATP-binding protein [Periwinkle leaf yellowing phytoplasma]WEX19699.1 MAG: amino acid ABC transporter ATP-binding protein [Candidatus Phytoplasma asteris]GAK74156.1 ABC-type polar amino acid transport system, ATPase component ['Chrysanthemum coronarium' phytoplasma]